jgi:hypothetical protein
MKIDGKKFREILNFFSLLRLDASMKLREKIENMHRCINVFYFIIDGHQLSSNLKMRVMEMENAKETDFD